MRITTSHNLIIIRLVQTQDTNAQTQITGYVGKADIKTESEPVFEERITPLGAIHALRRVKGLTDTLKD